MFYSQNVCSRRNGLWCQDRRPGVGRYSVPRTVFPKGSCASLEYLLEGLGVGRLVKGGSSETGACSWWALPLTYFPATTRPAVLLFPKHPAMLFYLITGWEAADQSAMALGSFDQVNPPPPQIWTSHIAGPVVESCWILPKINGELPVYTCVPPLGQ